MASKRQGLFSVDSDILSICSGSRIDPYTVAISHRDCQDFKISIQGQRNINSALNNLPLYRTPDERLQFGWGLESPLRSRGLHEGAYEHVATLIALGECFHESYAARVMQELTRSKSAATDYMPHFSQWKTLVHHLNGGFASADFGIMVEDFIRLDPYNIAWKLDDGSLGRFPIHPKSISEALVKLAELANGTTTQLTVVGSAVIAWLAAFSIWFYDFRIAVYSQEGKQLHASSPDQATQVLFVFTEKYGIDVSNEAWTTDQSQAARKSSVATYQTSVHATPFSGRVIWQSLLPRVFGQSFHHLDHEESKTLATLIGSAARTFEGLALGNARDTHPDLLSEQNRANPSSYGPGLIETLTNWLPELRRVQGRMERTLKLSHQDAATSYRDQLTRLREVCHCGICTSTPDEKDPKSMNLSSLLDTLPTKHGYCLTTLAETIIALGLALSRLTVSANIFPSRAGIQSFYESQVAKRLEARGKHWTEHFQIVYGNEWNAPDPRRLCNSIQIFSGSRPPDSNGFLPENLVAISHEGICAYFVSLEKSAGNKMHDEPVKLVRITSGAISVGQKVFEMAALGPVKGEDPADPWEEIKTEHLSMSLFCR